MGVFLKNGSQILTATEAEPVRLWNIADGSLVREFGEFSNHAWALRLVADDQSVVMGCRDGAVRFVTLNDGGVTRTLSSHRSFVRCVDVSADLATVLSGGMHDATVRVWDTATERCLAVLEGHRGGIYCVAFDRAGQRALSGSRDGTIRQWDVKTGQCSSVIDAHTHHVHGVAWSRDGRRALSCSRKIRLWDLEGGTCVRVFEGHNETVRSVIWSPDETSALSAGHDGTVRLWDIASGECIRVVAEHSTGAINAVWGPGGRILSCDWEGEVRIS